MNRRGFLGGILAAAAAPSIVSAESLMPIYVPKREIVIVPTHPLFKGGVGDYGQLRISSMLGSSGKPMHWINGQIVTPDHPLAHLCDDAARWLLSYQEKNPPTLRGILA